jgi:cytochrome c556
VWTYQKAHYAGQKAHYAGLLLILTLTLTALSMPAQADGVGAIAYRKAVMSSVGGHLKAIVGILKGQGGDKAHLLAHAESLAALAVITQDAFPLGSDAAAGKTDAAARIWEKPQDFKRATDAFISETAALAAAANTGDLRAFGKQLGVVGKVGCKGCHSAFRSK